MTVFSCFAEYTKFLKKLLTFLREYNILNKRCKNASVAQSVEQGTENPRVGGSIPPGGTIFNECHWHSLKNNTSVLRNRKLALEICRWHISTSVAFSAEKAIPPGDVASGGK